MSTKKVGGYKVPVIDLKATGRNIELLRKSAGVSVREIQNVMALQTLRLYTSGRKESHCLQSTTLLSLQLCWM